MREIEAGDFVYCIDDGEVTSGVPSRLTAGELYLVNSISGDQLHVWGDNGGIVQRRKSRFSLEESARPMAVTATEYQDILAGQEIYEDLVKSP